MRTGTSFRTCWLLFARSITVTYERTMSKGWIETQKGREREGGREKRREENYRCACHKATEESRPSIWGSLFHASSLAIHLCDEAFYAVNDIRVSLSSLWLSQLCSCEKTNFREIHESCIFWHIKQYISRNILYGHLLHFIEAIF